MSELETIVTELEKSGKDREPIKTAYNKACDNFISKQNEIDKIYKDREKIINATVDETIRKSIDVVISNFTTETNDLKVEIQTLEGTGSESVYQAQVDYDKSLIEVNEQEKLFKNLIEKKTKIDIYIKKCDDSIKLMDDEQEKNKKNMYFYFKKLDDSKKKLENSDCILSFEEFKAQLTKSWDNLIIKKIDLFQKEIKFDKRKADLVKKKSKLENLIKNCNKDILALINE